MTQTAEKVPLIAHLIELRQRLMFSVGALLLAFVACYLYVEPIYNFLVQPLASAFADPAHKRLIYTGLAEAFFTYIKLALFAAFFLSFPILATQFYRFLAPGLYKNERRVLVPYLAAAPILFLLGAALAYYYIIPLAWKFFVSFETAGIGGALPIQLEARVSEYLSLVMQVIIVFGLSFQLPIALTLLVRSGALSVATLQRGRRYAIVIIVTVAAFITPPDIFSQIGLSIPLYLLYELSIFCCRFIEKQRDTETMGGEE